MRTKLLAGLRAASFFFARRGDGVPVGYDAINATPRSAVFIDTTPRAIDTTAIDGEDFQQRRAAPLASRSSPECGSAKKGGDLGMFRRGKMSAAFELAAFNLDVHGRRRRRRAVV